MLMLHSSSSLSLSSDEEERQSASTSAADFTTLRSVSLTSQGYQWEEKESFRPRRASKGKENGITFDNYGRAPPPRGLGTTTDDGGCGYACGEEDGQDRVLHPEREKLLVLRESMSERRKTNLVQWEELLAERKMRLVSLSGELDELEAQFEVRSALAEKTLANVERDEAMVIARIQALEERENELCQQETSVSQLEKQQQQRRRQRQPQPQQQQQNQTGSVCLSMPMAMPAATGVALLSNGQNSSQGHATADFSGSVDSGVEQQQNPQQEPRRGGPFLLPPIRSTVPTDMDTPSLVVAPPLGGMGCTSAVVGRGDCVDAPRAETDNASIYKGQQRWVPRRGGSRFASRSNRSRLCSVM